VKKRSERLDIVSQAAAQTERERAERVGAAERHVQEMQDKLAALEKYRSEYEAGFKSRAGAGADVIRMRDFQTFLGKLGEALTQQRELVALAGRALEKERSHVVDTLQERWQSEESRAADRRDQQESDELSSQRASNRERNQ
jgi:flagellar FliJ protein